MVQRPAAQAQYLTYISNGSCVSGNIKEVDRLIYNKLHSILFMRKFQLEGSEFKECEWNNGPDLSAEQTKDIRLKIKNEPNDLASRLLLFGRGFLGHSGSWAPHLMWLINNHSKHFVHQYVSPTKDDEQYRKARESWLAQVQSNPADVTVLCNAARFFQTLAPEESVEYLERACNLDPLDEELPMRLSQQFRGMAWRNSGKEAESFAHQAANKMKLAIELYAKPSSEDSYLLPYFGMELQDIANVALDFKLLDDAIELANLLLNHKSINSQRLQTVGASDNGIYDLSINRGLRIGPSSSINLQ